MDLQWNLHCSMMETRRGGLRPWLLLLVLLLAVFERNSSYALLPQRSLLLSEARGAVCRLPSRGPLRLAGTFTPSLPVEPAVAATGSVQGFVDSIRAGRKLDSINQSFELIDRWFTYVPVSFANGDIVNPANVNTGSAKIFSFAFLMKLSEEETLRLFGPLSENISPDGTDHPNIRNFIKYGWKGIHFDNGLAISSKADAADA